MSNSILPAAGNLDIVNANVRADKFNAATNIGVANTNPDFNFSVGDKFHVDKDSTDPVSITGNVVASGIKISNLTIGPAFDFASVSNVGNVTANVIQFANATTGFTTTANVEIGGNIALTSNAQVTIGSNVLAEYTGPHPREPKEMPLKKFPEIAFADNQLDGDHTTNTYTQAGYTVMVSNQFIDSFNHREGWKVFNNKTSHWLDSWMTESSRYSTSTRLHIAGVSTTVSSVSYLGDYVQLEFPKKVSVSYVNIYASDRISRMPGVIVFAGSDNGTTWTLINSVTNNTHVPGESSVFNVNATQHYKYLRMIITEVTTADISQINDRVSIQEIQIYGYEESAPVGDLSLDTTLKSTFNSVRSNNYVMYFDGKDPNGTDPKNLVSGSSISLTNNNATYDASNDYWTLDGSTESNVTTGDLGFEGDAPHTVSMWVNSSNLDANAMTQQLFSIGSGYDKSFLKVDDTQIAANTWQNVTYTYQGEGGSRVTYVDGRKVADEKIRDTHGEFPPFPMRDYITGGFRVWASTVYANPNAVDIYSPWFAFDKYNDDGAGADAGDRDLGFIWEDHAYNGNTYLRDKNLGIDTGGVSTTVSGEYLVLEMPYKIVPEYFKIKERGDLTAKTVKDGKIYGSNDGSTWDEISSFSGLTYTNTRDTFATFIESNMQHRTVRINTTNSYNRLALVCTAVNQGSEDWTGIGDLRYYGYKEGDITRFPQPGKIHRYPHVALTGPRHRGYVVTASANTTSGGDGPFNAFINDPNNDPGTTGVHGHYWHGDNSIDSYDTNSPYDVVSASSTTVDGTPVSGAWIQLELPRAIIPKGFRISPRSGQASRAPQQGVLAGSNNGTSWTNIHNFTAPGTYTDRVYQTTEFSNTTAYKYLRFIVTHLQGNGGVVNLGNMEYLGTEEEEDVPAIVGGPFAGKVANFRVYDKYLGDERIQEIYDAQKDEFGHKKSSVTFYKGRIGVGTTEPEGALVVVDEPRAMEKFPARGIDGNEAHVEGQGIFRVSAPHNFVAGELMANVYSALSDPFTGLNRRKEGYRSAYRAFNELHELSWNSTPPRHTRLAENTEYGTWLKLESPEKINLKKVEIHGNMEWHQIGKTIYGRNDGGTSDDQLGRTIDCSHDGTRILAGAYQGNSNEGEAWVLDWDGEEWSVVGNILTNPVSTGDTRFGRRLCISGDGNIIAIGAGTEDNANGNNAGSLRVYYLDGGTNGVGGTWTLLPDSSGITTNGAFQGATAGGNMGENGPQLSYDGKILVVGEKDYVDNGVNVGRVQVFRYANGAWSQMGLDLVGATSGSFGNDVQMTEDGMHLVIGQNASPDAVYVYRWNESGSSWDLKGSSITHSTTGARFGEAVSISNDGNVIAVGMAQAGVADGAWFDFAGQVRVYHYNSSTNNWDLNTTIQYEQANSADDGGAGAYDSFGQMVRLSGDGKRLIVSAANDDGPLGVDQGKLLMYEYIGGKWLQKHPALNYELKGMSANSYLGHGTINHDQGFAFSRDGSVIVGGELGVDTSGSNNTGAFRAFGMTNNIKSVWGSNDNKNWTKVVNTPTREESTSNVAGVSFGTDDRLELKNFDNSNYFKYHAIIADAFTDLRHVNLYGISEKGTSVLNDGSLSLSKNLTVPRIGPPLNMDKTPRRDRLLVEYNTSTNPITKGIVRDTSGRNNHGGFINLIYSGVNVSGFRNKDAPNTHELLNYDPFAKAFFFKARGNSDADDGIKVANIGSHIKGNHPLTASFWARLQGDADQGFFYIGNETHDINKSFGMRLDVGSTNYNMELSLCGGGATNFYRYELGDHTGGDAAVVPGADQRVGDFFNGKQGFKWFHVVAVYNGGLRSADGDIYSHGNTDLMRLYINGNEVFTMNNSSYESGVNGSSSDILNLDPNPTLIVGGFPGGQAIGNTNTAMRGFMSNFKLYDCALTGEEAKTLYDMGRSDEGHHVVNFDKTRVGIGLGDGESPKGTLDIRGDCIINKHGRVGIGITQPRAPLHIESHYVYDIGPYIKDDFLFCEWSSGNGGRWTLSANEGDDAHIGGSDINMNLVWGALTSSIAPDVDNVMTFENDIPGNTDIGVVQSFTGQHRCVIPSIPLAQIEAYKGYIVSADQNNYINLNGPALETGANAININECIPIVSLSTTKKDKKCFGVIANVEDPGKRKERSGRVVSLFNKEIGDTRVFVNSLGEGAIWVINTNGTLVSGDYITTSDVTGYGEKQDTEFLANYTVAKITMDCDFNPVTQSVKQIVKDANGNNILDDNGHVQWEDHPTKTEKAYKIKYLDANGVETDEVNAVHIAAFVGCTYHCG